MPMLVLCRTLICNPCICPKMDTTYDCFSPIIRRYDLALNRGVMEKIILLTETFKQVTKLPHRRPADFWRLQCGVLMSLPLSCNRIRRLFNAGI